MKQMILIKTIVVILILPIFLNAQNAVDLSDEDLIRFRLNGIQQAIQQSKPGKIFSFLNVNTKVDSLNTTNQQFKTLISGILNNVVDRDIYISNPVNDKLGTFWDFELKVKEIVFTDSICVVDCKYSVYSSGLRSGNGKIIYEKINNNWQLANLEGLIIFLQTEVEVLNKKQKIEGARNESM